MLGYGEVCFNNCVGLLCGLTVLTRLELVDQTRGILHVEIFRVGDIELGQDSGHVETLRLADRENGAQSQAGKNKRPGWKNLNS